MLFTVSLKMLAPEVQEMKTALRQLAALVGGGLLGVASHHTNSSLAVIGAVAAGAFLRQRGAEETGTLLGSWMIAWTLIINW